MWAALSPIILQTDFCTVGGPTPLQGSGVNVHAGIWSLCGINTGRPSNNVSIKWNNGESGRQTHQATHKCFSQDPLTNDSAVNSCGVCYLLSWELKLKVIGCTLELSVSQRWVLHLMLLSSTLMLLRWNPFSLWAGLHCTWTQHMCKIFYLCDLCI